MRGRLLGPGGVLGGRVTPPGPRPRRQAVLAVLARRAGDIVSVDELTEVVWAGEPPATAVNTLQRHVSHLRQAMGSRDGIVARSPGYLLDPDHVDTDVAVADRLIRQGAQ